MHWSATQPQPTGLARLVRRIPWIVVVAIVLYGVAAWVVYRPLGLVDRSHLTLGNDNNDVWQQVWVLALAHSEVVGGHLSFFTTAIDHTRGVNLLDSATMPLLAVVMSPVTGLVGPIAAYGLLLRIALLASSTSCLLALRRVIASDVGAAAGGAVYAFAPYMTHQASVHVFLTFAPLPPIMAVVVYRRLSGQGGHPFRSGLLLGVLSVGQYLIDSELLISLALILGVTVAIFGVLSLIHPGELVDRARILGRLLAGTAVVAVPLLAYPAWFALAGPEHVSGPLLGLHLGGATPGELLRPATYGLLTSPSRVTSIDFGDQQYLGLTLLVVLAVIVVVNWRSQLVRVVTVMGIVALVFSFGPYLIVAHHRIPMPFGLLENVPVVHDLAATRLAFYVDAAAAALVAVGVGWCGDRLAEERRWLGLVGGAAIVAGCAFLVPVGRFAFARTTTADAFAGRAERIIPVGAVAVAYPQPGFVSSKSMGWQAESAIRFDLLGGYALRSMPNGRFTRNPPPLMPNEIAAFLGQSTSPWSVAQVREDLPAFARRSHVTAALVDSTAPGAGPVIATLAAVYGPPRRIAAVDVWTDLGERGPARSPAGGPGTTSVVARVGSSQRAR